MTSPSRIVLTVAVAWDGTWNFDGPYDYVSRDVDGDPGVAIAEGRDGAQQLSPPRVMSGSFELINEDAKYSQENAGSPLYQRIEPNRPVRYAVTIGAERLWDSPATWDNPGVWDGIGSRYLGQQMIDSIEERSGWGDKRVAVETIGIETLLTRTPVTIPLMTNVRVDQAVHAILDAADWPWEKRIIDVSDTMLLYYWVDARRPWDALLELLASEGPGTFHVDFAGNFVFESRNHRTIQAPSVTSQATFYDTRVTGHYWYTDVQYSPAFRNIYNQATYTTRRRALASLAPVWTYGATLSLTAGQSQTFIIRPTDGNPFTGAVTPVSPTDYTVTAGALSSVTLSASSGLVAFLTLTAGGSGATVTGLQLRAQSLTVVSETTVTNTVDTSDSIERYSPIPGADIPLTLTVAGWPEVDPAVAQAVCNAWVLRQQWPRATLTFTIANADAAHIDQILNRRVSDRLTLHQAHSGMVTDVWINSLEYHFYGFDGARADLVIGAERCDTLGGAVWNTAIWNADDVPPLESATSVWGV